MLLVDPSLVCQLFHALIRAKVTTACAMSGSDCTEVAALKTNIMNNLDKRFPMNEFVTMATLLDPASKNKKFLNMSLEEKRNLLLAAIFEKPVPVA